LAGVFCTTLIMVWVYYGIFGFQERSFYHQNFAAARFNLNLKPGDAIWGASDFSWIRTGGWILVPVLAFLTGVAALVRRVITGVPLPRAYAAIIAAYCYAFLVLCYFTMRETHVLQFDYYATILMPLEYILLGIFVFKPPKQMLKWFGLAIGVMLAILLAPHWRIPFVDEPNIAWHYVVGFAVILAVLVRLRAATWIAAITGLAVASWGLVPRYPASAWKWQYNGVAAYKRVVDAVRAVDANTPPHQFPVLWFNNHDALDHNTSERRAIMCALQVHGNAMQNYPEVDKARKYAPGTTLVLITNGRDVFDDANARMTAAGMPLRLKNQVQISGEGFSIGERAFYWLTFTEVLAPQAAPAPARM
jgi:hypothetical protein